MWLSRLLFGSVRMDYVVMIVQYSIAGNVVTSSPFFQGSTLTFQPTLFSNQFSGVAVEDFL